MTGKDIAWNHEGGAYEQTEAIRRHIGVGAYCGDERDPDPFHRRNLLCRRRRPAGTGLIPGGGNGGERYDCFGRVSGIDDKYDPGSLSGTISRSYVYDALDHVTQITCAMGNDQREQYGYIYDAAGRITAETSAAAYPVNGTTCSLQKSLAYAYDAAGRLTAVTGSRQEAGITTAVNRQYEYDAAGNRTRQTDGNIVTEYSYNSLDQMTQAVSRQGETLISDITCLYDVDGNQIREEDSVQNTVTTLAYDPADQLTRVTKTENNVQTLVQENRYDGDGQRISKNVQTQTTGNVDSCMRNYHYQGGEVLYTDDGTQTDAFRLLGPGGNAISTVHMGSTGEVWYLYGSDIRGSITTLTDENGDIAAAYDYEEFGETEALAGADVDNEVGYTGQIRDRESGLYYYNARYYDPAYGRFLTQDTCRGEQTDPQTLHLYAYCANDPVNHTDPSGHSEKTIKASKTVKYYSPVIDAGHIVWRITATLSVTYKKSGKKRTIKKMNFWAVGDKHTNCGNGTCRFNKVKLYKSKKLWKTIKGTDKVVVPGDGLWLKQSQICYTDKKIDKTYKMGAKKTRVVAFFYFMPPPEALFRAGVEIKPEVSF